MVDQSYLFIFLSHKDEIKDEVQKLKEGLERYGVNAFVAHSDIPAGTEWQNEILGALEDMDAFVPVLTKDFPDSPWTDQEVGYAIAKGVPIVPIRLGLDPYGFMGKFQALTCEWKDAPKEIITALTLYPSFVNTLIDTVAECSDYDTANRLSRILPLIANLTSEQITRLIDAFNENPNVTNSYGFNGASPGTYGLGLAAHLIEWTGRDYEVKTNWRGQFYIDQFNKLPYWGFGTIR